MRASPASLAAAAAVALILDGCSPRGGRVALSVEGPLATRAAAVVAREPLPPGWSPAAPGTKADASVSLAAAEPGAGAAGAAAFVAGRLWLAPALDLADARYALSETEARAVGLEELAAILPPRRAPRVDGRWPGEEGYPLARSLLLSVAGPGGSRPPRALAAWADRAAAAARAAEERPSVLMAVGDMQAGAAEAPILAAGGARNRELLRGGLVDALRGADFLVGNLEGPVSARGSPNPRKRFLFRMPPGTGRSLLDAGFDLVLFANNHAFDYGPLAFADTLRELDEAGLPFVGAGADGSAALARRRLEARGGGPLVFIGFAAYPRERLGFTTEEAAAGPGRPGINADEEATIAAVRAAAAAGETVVVLAHGGDEYVPSPPPYLRERYHRFADAGAFLVIGSHPHVLQGVEARGESLIAYSLGNFLFTGLEEPLLSVRSAALSFLVYEGRVRGLALEPVIVDPRGSSPDPDRAGAERRFAAACAALGRSRTGR